jgi:hypothetical protein
LLWSLWWDSKPEICPARMSRNSLGFFMRTTL